MIGHGSESEYSYVNYGAQFCLPRNITDPIISIRYRENTSWGGWSGITAAALTSGDKTIAANLLMY